MFTYFGLSSYFQSMKTKYWHKGVTLIELLVVVAIIGVLASVVIVSIQGARTKARSAKALAQLSSVIPSIISCWGNEGSVNASGDICTRGASYGAWPDMTTVGYTLSNADVTGAKKSTWYFSATNSADGITICCNSRMNSCGKPSGSCDASVVW